MTPRVGSMPGSRFTFLAVFLIASLSYISAQGNLGKQLTDYVGTYADVPGHPVEIVAGDGLFAVIDEGKYPLRPTGVDQVADLLYVCVVKHIPPYDCFILPVGVFLARRPASAAALRALRLAGDIFAQLSRLALRTVASHSSCLGWFALRGWLGCTRRLFFLPPRI